MSRSPTRCAGPVGGGALAAEGGGAVGRRRTTRLFGLPSQSCKVTERRSVAFDCSVRSQPTPVAALAALAHPAQPRRGLPARAIRRPSSPRALPGRGAFAKLPPIWTRPQVTADVITGGFLVEGTERCDSCRRAANRLQSALNRRTRTLPTGLRASLCGVRGTGSRVHGLLGSPALQEVS